MEDIIISVYCEGNTITISDAGDGESFLVYLRVGTCPTCNRVYVMNVHNLPIFSYFMYFCGQLNRKWTHSQQPPISGYIINRAIDPHNAPPILKGNISTSIANALSTWADEAVYHPAKRPIKHWESLSL
mgnify:CR=1 FL=1